MKPDFNNCVEVVIYPGYQLGGSVTGSKLFNNFTSEWLGLSRSIVSISPQFIRNMFSDCVRGISWWTSCLTALLWWKMIFLLYLVYMYHVLRIPTGILFAEWVLNSEKDQWFTFVMMLGCTKRRLTRLILMHFLWWFSLWLKLSAAPCSISEVI